MKKIVSLLLTICLLFSGMPFGASTFTVSATTKTKDQAITWLDGLVGTKVGSGQCVALIQAYYQYLGAPTPYGKGCDYATNTLPTGWQRIKGATPQKGDILVWTQGYLNYGHVAICGGASKYYHQNWNYKQYVQIVAQSYTGGVSAGDGYYANYWGVIRPNFTSYSASLVTPTITFDKSSYTMGDTITVSWKASPSNSNLSHYWISVTDSAGKTYISEGIKSKTSYSFKTPGVGTYKVKIYATPIGSESGEGSLTDTKSITIKAVCNHKYTNACDATCNGCGKTRTVKGHSFVSKITKNPTCSTKGACTYTCSICNYSYMATLSATGLHKFSDPCDATCNQCGISRSVHSYVSATCKAPKTCKLCGKTSGSKLSHKYDSGKITTKATCKTTGAKTYVCTVCGTAKSDSVPKLTMHTYTTVCDTNCNVCGAARTVTHTYGTATTKATLSKNGSIVKKCAVCGDVESNNAINLVSSITLSDTEYTYNGSIKKPTVTVKDSAGKKLKNGTDYTVSYAKGRKKVGAYKVTVTLKGNYSGKKVLTFKINPPKSSVKKLTAAKKSLKVKFAKKTKEVTGYEIQYSTSKKFKSTKKVTVKKAKTTTATIKKLKAKKTYYVRVRTYKIVKGKKYYSAWSKALKKKTK